MVGRLLPCTAIGVLLVSMRAAPAEERKADAPLTFEKTIRPILKANCFQCHGEEGRKAELDVRLRHLLVKGGDSGPVVVPGKRAESLIYQKLTREEMPPGKRKKLSKAEIELIGHWIDAGAPTAGAEPDKPPAPGEPSAEERAFWSFRPIRRPVVPAANDPRIRTPIDAFLLAAMKPQALTFSPDADKATLLRRASFDLTGLPPTPEEVAAFVSDKSADAYEKAIDRLLASPHYGERWGRHWLDVAGYADSDGATEADPERRFAYKYRDYVIRSFNADKPFNQFIQEQLAGDELAGYPRANLGPEEIEKLTATGFLRMAPDGTGAGDVDQGAARNQVMADTLEIVSTSLLGLTVACAQCHNHRYDPISQADYYRLRAIFEPAYDWKNWRPPRLRLLSLLTDADRKQAAELEAEAAAVDQERLEKQNVLVEKAFAKELSQIPEAQRDKVLEAIRTPVARRTAEQRKLLQPYPPLTVDPTQAVRRLGQGAVQELQQYSDRAAAIRAKKPPEDSIPVLTENPGRVPTTYLFFRGDHQVPKEAVAPGEPTVLGKKELPAKDPELATTGRRLAFARRLTDGTHPLTPRVLVNRVWLHHFGQGLVSTPADFGALGERPTHPELLDWLASEFMAPEASGGRQASAWSMKALHKLIMTSTAYRQSSVRDPRKQATDPDNRYLWRMPVRRLEAEVIRDAMLAVSGKLNPKTFGPPVPVMPDELGQIVPGMQILNAGIPQRVVPIGDEEFRRSVYIQVRRSRPLSILETFDHPAMTPNCTARSSSAAATQALMLMNSSFVTAQAEQFARRVRQEAGEERQKQVALALRLAYAFEPTAAEIEEAVEFLEKQAGRFRDKAADAPLTPDPSPPKGARGAAPTPEEQALASFCHVLLSANQFLYVD